MLDISEAYQLPYIGLLEGNYLLFCVFREHLAVDPQSEPLAGERVPYVIIYGSPGLPLIRLVKK